MDASSSGTRFIAWPELKPRVPYTRQHLGRLEAAGRFPRRVRLGANGRVAWLESEIEAWIKARIAERDAGKAA
jgi:prophage regulatory protein